MKRPVICRKCNHEFDSTIENPRCSKCGSSRVSNIEDIPKIYGGKELKKLREEFEAYKALTDSLLDRIEALEGKTPEPKKEVTDIHRPKEEVQHITKIEKKEFVNVREPKEDKRTFMQKIGL